MPQIYDIIYNDVKIRHIFSSESTTGKTLPQVVHGNSIIQTTFSGIYCEIQDSKPEAGILITPQARLKRLRTY